mgnify:CR=1 FL=1
MNLHRSIRRVGSVRRGLGRELRSRRQLAGRTPAGVVWFPLGLQALLACFGCTCDPVNALYETVVPETEMLPSTTPSCAMLTTAPSVPVRLNCATGCPAATTSRLSPTCARWGVKRPQPNGLLAVP